MSDLKLRPWADYTQSKMKPFPKPEEMGQKTPENNWTLPEVDVRSQDISAKDLSPYNMQGISFDDKTKWPTNPKKCPKGYTDMDKMMELGKEPGLGVRKLHQQGIDGAGLSMAIIDQPLGDHIEYHDNLVHYEEIGYDDRDKQRASMHGSAVASIAVGKNCGIAPKAKLYYFAAQHLVREENHQLTARNCSKALERIMTINETLPEKERIQVVSLSWGGQGNPQKTLYSGFWLKTLEKAKQKGLFVLTCASDREYKFFLEGSGRRVLSNPNQSTSFHKEYFDIPDDYRALQEILAVPSDHRTLASPTGRDDYVHYANGGWSWTRPWMAGMFLLARQVNPKITPKHFWQVALETGTINKKVGMRMINPVELIEAVQKEKGTCTLKKTIKNGIDEAIITKMKGKQNGN